MDIGPGFQEHSRSLNPPDSGHAGIFVGEVRALFAALIASGTHAEHGPGDHSGSTGFTSGDVVVFIGENSRFTGEGSLQRAIARRHGAEIIVVGFEPSVSGDGAISQYLIRPGSDLALLCGLANILIASGWVGRGSLDSESADLEPIARFVEQFTTDRVCAETGLMPEELWHFAQTVADGARTSFHWAKSSRTGLKDQPAS